MLRSAVRRLEDIAPASNAAIGCRRAPRAEAEQCLERGHGLLPSIVPKHELVEVHLQLRAAHAVIRSDQPLLEVPDGAICQWHDRGGTFAEGRTRRLGASDVSEVRFRQHGETGQPVGVDRRARRDVLLDHRRDRRPFEIRQDAHPHAPGAIAPFFNSHQNGNRVAPFQLPTASKPRLRTTNPGVIDFDVPVQGLPGGVDHRAAQLVEHHPRGFIATQAELTLEQECGHAALVGRHQIRRPKPQRQWSLCVVKDRAGRQGHLMPARRALPASVRHEGVGARVGTSRASEPLGPPTRGEVLLARFFSGELTLKLAHISGKRRARHAPTLLTVAS